MNMTSFTSFIININNLPIELQYNIFSYLSLEELFILNKLQINQFTSISSYIDYYLDNHKYKYKLKDCMYLIMFEEYRDLIFEYLYELFTNIGIKFVNDVGKVGGATSYHNLSMEENPREIYTIRVIMKKDFTEFEYELTSIGHINNNMINYNFGYINLPKNTRFLDCNIYKICDELVNLVDILRLDNRKIISIKYCSEKYSHDFIILKTSTIITDQMLLTY